MADKQTTVSQAFGTDFVAIIKIEAVLDLAETLDIPPFQMLSTISQLVTQGILLDEHVVDLVDPRLLIDSLA